MEAEGLLEKLIPGVQMGQDFIQGVFLKLRNFLKTFFNLTLFVTSRRCHVAISKHRDIEGTQKTQASVTS